MVSKTMDDLPDPDTPVKILTPVIAGRIRPTPPRNSQTPMKTNRACGTAENQGTRGSIRFHTAWLKQRTFPKPVKLKNTPHKTCTVQSEVFMVDLLSHLLYLARQHYDETRWGNVTDGRKTVAGREI